MFSADIYKKRRLELKKKVKNGLIIFIGNEQSPINFRDNTYPFRQDSSFLYFFGLDFPNLDGAIDIDEDREYLVGVESTIEDIIWYGKQVSLTEKSFRAGIGEAIDQKTLKNLVQKAQRSKRKIHFLPPYRAESVLELSDYLALPPSQINYLASQELIEAVISLREIKDLEEVEEIKKAINVTSAMFTEVITMTQDGTNEKTIIATMNKKATLSDCTFSFSPIITKNGAALHNPNTNNIIKSGEIVLCDSGLETTGHYGSDITRTFPVDKKFSLQQKEIYTIVLRAQETAFSLIKPGVQYLDIHLSICKIITNCMIEIGLMKGDAEEAVQQGAHALFFPHGLGHMLGLDIHDMESLGEDYVGYGTTMKRSDAFGLHSLRLAKKLKSGFVLTVEPGIYFIPELIALWESKKMNTDFINYSKVKYYLDFGGIRIEDNCLVTDTANQNLSNHIPKSIKEIEGLRNASTI